MFGLFPRFKKLCKLAHVDCCMLWLESPTGSQSNEDMCHHLLVSRNDERKTAIKQSHSCQIMLHAQCSIKLVGFVKDPVLLV